MLKKIVLFNKTIISGGIEKCIENLTKQFRGNYEFEVCYFDDSILDQNIVNIILIENSNPSNKASPNSNTFWIKIIGIKDNI